MNSIEPPELKRIVDEQVAQRVQRWRGRIVYVSALLFLLVFNGIMLVTATPRYENADTASQLNTLIICLVLALVGWALTVGLQIAGNVLNNRSNQAKMREEIISREMASQMYQQWERLETPVKPKRLEEERYVELGDDGEFVEVEKDARRTVRG